MALPTGLALKEVEELLTQERKLVRRGENAQVRNYLLPASDALSPSNTYVFPPPPPPPRPCSSSHGPPH